MKRSPKRKPSNKTSAGLAVYKVPEAAAELAMSEMRVRNLIDEGRLAAVNVGGGSKKVWRIPAEALETYKTRQRSLNVEAKR